MDELLSRPYDEPYSGLIEHSVKVAELAKEIIMKTGFDLSEAAYFAGLFHDLGKINPFYQKIFHAPPSEREKLREELSKVYSSKHSLLSACASYWLLRSLGFVNDKKFISLVTASILSHHSTLKNLWNMKIPPKEKELFKRSANAMKDGLRVIGEELLSNRYQSVKFENALKYIHMIPQPDEYSLEQNPLLGYVEFCALYSSLLLADRGSFHQPTTPHFNLKFDTNVMVKRGELSELREAFQKHLLESLTLDKKMMVLRAPTGIGKTRIFLEVLKRIQEKQCFEKVFYFSPLLALTDDFEIKMFRGDDVKGIKPIAKGDPETILIYNYAFQGTLKEKELSEEEEEGLKTADFSKRPSHFFKTRENFEMESFNKQMVITTTQRLLMILYSNSTHDKMKLLSFKNSLLILDEVQTIPKFLLPNFLEQLSVLSEKLDTWVLLVSATMPSQIRNFDKLAILKTPSDIERIYLEKTKKNVKFVSSLTPQEIASYEDGPNLVMLNTRKKAVNFFSSIPSSVNKLMYLSSGVIKEQRMDRINEIREGRSSPTTVVSTQVVEAGVDISFKRMFREIAPLDNIVQAMGRLNREVEVKTTPTLIVFTIDGVPTPYPELEITETKRILGQIQDSLDLYNSLEEYYNILEMKNRSNIETTRKLNELIKYLDFPNIWQLVNKIFEDESQEVVYIPKIEHLDSFKKVILNSPNKISRILKDYSKRTAVLPVNINKIDYLLDDDLKQYGILCPRHDTYEVLYDRSVGLDKWIVKDKQDA